ncbi:MAG TPA: hypothetical protein VGO96_20495 [Pyrinomonadaceae bacterium]|jgi:hypothetical protein|nr:hypothetical protein [Pyrinomonadaceae bacterium]
MKKVPFVLFLLLLCALSPVASFGKLLRRQQQQQQPPATTATPQTPAQTPAAPPNPCAEPTFRQFDFWVGKWVVKDAKGMEIGRSEITKVANGCAILESWMGRDGIPGTSLNYFDNKLGKWNQHWVGGGGQVLHLSGSLEDKVMILSGVRVTPKGQIINRISWTLLADGRVEQEWNISTDGGQNWTKSFDGFYSRQ